MDGQAWVVVAGMRRHSTCGQLLGGEQKISLTAGSSQQASLLVAHESWLKLRSTLGLRGGVST